MGIALPLCIGVMDCAGKDNPGRPGRAGSISFAVDSAGECGGEMGNYLQVRVFDANGTEHHMPMDCVGGGKFPWFWSRTFSAGTWTLTLDQDNACSPAVIRWSVAVDKGLHRLIGITNRRGIGAEEQFQWDRWAEPTKDGTEALIVNLTEATASVGFDGDGDGRPELTSAVTPSSYAFVPVSRVDLSDHTFVADVDGAAISGTAEYLGLSSDEHEGRYVSCLLASDRAGGYTLDCVFQNSPLVGHGAWYVSG